MHAALRSVTTTLLVALAAGSCAAGELLGPDAPQGIDGLVLSGPQCPVQSLDDPCPDLPYQAWIAIRLDSGRYVTAVRSGEDGRFRVGLSPGRYRLEPEQGHPFPAASPFDVEVIAGSYTEVVVSYDTGIR